MLKKVIIALVFTTLSICNANAQKPQTKAQKVVADVAKTIGADGLKSIQYSANGYYYHFLQGYLDPSVSDPGPWTKFYAVYTRSIDYRQNISREEMTWSQFSNPPRGGGYQPMYTPGTMTSVTSNTIGWESMQRGSPTGGGQPVLTPQGFIQVAEAGDPSLRVAAIGGQSFKVVSLQLPGPYKIKVEAYIDKDNLIKKIDTWMPSIIVGDILIEHTFSNYRDFDSVKFPMRIVKTYMGTPALELNVTDVKPNASVDLKPPREPQPTQVKSFKIGDGVWFIDGPGASTAAVEFKDYVVLVESSTSEEHALANIAETKKLFPNKPIRYDINSHYHGDHAGGLRAFIAEGATIITPAGNRDFYERVVLKDPWVLEPDQLALHPKSAHFIWVDDKYVLSDGDRKMETYTVQGEGHCKNILITYMPKEKLLFETDMLDNVDPASLKTVHHPNFPPPGIVSPYTWALWENIQRLHLDVQQIVQCHGHGAVPVDILKERVKGKVESAQIKAPY